MVTLEVQIRKRCIHFTGVMDKVCKKGISYADVRVGKPYQFPCLQQGGECEHAKFPTDEEVLKEIAAIEKMSIDALTAVALVKSHFAKTKEASGTLTCACGGKLKYVRANTNGHFWAKCGSCGISFNE